MNSEPKNAKTAYDNRLSGLDGDNYLTVARLSSKTIFSPIDGMFDMPPLPIQMERQLLKEPRCQK